MKIVELGCGFNKRIKGAIGVDILKTDCVDIVADINNGLSYFEDDSIDEIYSHHFLEHVNDLTKLMHEVYRVLKPGGKFHGEVPHFTNPYYYSDPTHKTFFGFYTFNYFDKNQNEFKRKVPAFYNKLDFKIERYNLVFKSYSSKKSKSLYYKILNKIFNRNTKYQELYEARYSKFFSCYELYFCISKR